MLTVCTYLWRSDGTDKFARYTPDDVRLLQRQVARHLSVPHEFVCITDQSEAFDGDADIRAVPLDRTTHVPGTCYVRLFTFSPQATKVLGSRVLQLDLDTVIVGDIGPIVDRDEDLVLWRNPRKWCLSYPEVGYAKALAWFNASVILHSPGTMCVIWQNFHETRIHARDDQWLISDYAGKDNPYWDQSHGIYRQASPRKLWQGFRGTLPANARIVSFPGNSSGKPWQRDVISANPWINEHRI